MSQRIPEGPWRWLAPGVLIQDSGPRNAVLCPMRVSYSENRTIGTRGADGLLHEIDPDSEIGLALAVLPELVAFVRRVAFEPIGPADASPNSVLDTLEAEAKVLVYKIFKPEAPCTPV